jgi:integral membrane protein
MIKLFRHIAFWEGISLILLLFIAMPIKYILKQDVLVKYVGMAHGVLFILYVVLAILVYQKMKWKPKELIFVLFLSLVPFGTFYMEKKYL